MSGAELAYIVVLWAVKGHVLPCLVGAEVCPIRSSIKIAIGNPCDEDPPSGGVFYSLPGVCGYASRPNGIRYRSSSRQICNRLRAYTYEFSKNVVFASSHARLCHAKGGRAESVSDSDLLRRRLSNVSNLGAHGYGPRNVVYRAIDRNVSALLCLMVSKGPGADSGRFFGRGSKAVLLGDTSFHRANLCLICSFNLRHLPRELRPFVSQSDRSRFCGGFCGHGSFRLSDSQPPLLANADVKFSKLRFNVTRVGGGLGSFFSQLIAHRFQLPSGNPRVDQSGNGDHSGERNHPLLAAAVGSFLLLLAFASGIGFVSVGVYSESRWAAWLIIGLIGLTLACVY